MSAERIERITTMLDDEIQQAENEAQTATAASLAATGRLDEVSLAASDVYVALRKAKDALELHRVMTSNLETLRSRRGDDLPVLYEYLAADSVPLRACEEGDFVSLQTTAQISIPNENYPGDFECPEPKYIRRDCGWVEKARITKSAWAEIANNSQEYTDAAMRDLMFRD